jgi:chorismate mutase
MNILDQWRNEIDQLDRELVRLLNARATLALSIGALKRRLGLPMRSAEREQKVLTNVRLSNEGPLSEESLQRIFRQIMDECLRIEEESSP